MAYTSKQVVTSVSIVYLVLVTALAAYATSRAKSLSIPIPDALSGLATALPIVAGLLLEAGYDFTRRVEQRRQRPKGNTPRPPLVIIVNTLIFIYSTAVITLLGTHVAPSSGLRCGLDQRWRDLFTHKNADAIRAIQDAFNCCGYVNSHDQAWPFPDKNHDQHACETAFGRTRGCLGPWRHEEQRVAGILMAVVAMVFVWQFAIIVTPTQRESWLHRVLPARVSRLISDEERGTSGRPRGAIDYVPYRDNVAEEVDDEDRYDATRPAIEGRTIRHVPPEPNGEQDQSRSGVENVWERS
ncbi:uncharacterized protein EI97DRAFT_161140 [Westerdykella ornata]|uniref:Tetraspanin Tsp3 n=1 Tax=Westerdykella ornata TaxID=318751 RepID=A0A6A6J9R1_WESOR|nr:uncharacterized protein EI97DRAFT_161140 [Westerdykella ornata]KAF2273330.1 hypothetical protein EI97DRAFT_161140 [Westerdykella ornata]